MESQERLLTPDVVCDPPGHAGVVHGLCHPAHVHLQAVVRAALAVLRVALAVARLSTLSFVTPGPWRPRRPHDGTANVVT